MEYRVLTNIQRRRSCSSFSGMQRASFIPNMCRRNQRLIRTLRTVLIWHLQIYSYSQSWRRYSEINIFLDPEVQTVNLINSKQESCFLDEMKKWIKCFEKNVEKIIIFIVSTINVLHFQTGFNILPLLILMLHSWRPYNSTRTFTKFLSISFLVE